MPYDAHLLNLMRRALVNRPGIHEKKMFGGYCWMLNGNMLCGVEVGRFMFRVGKELEEEARKKPGASPMDIGGPDSSGPPDGVQYPLGSHGQAEYPSPGGIEDRVCHSGPHVDDGGFSTTLGSQIVI